MQFDSVFNNSLIMKILLTLFVLLFSSSVFADDISDFEIEGISIGDSLLDYYNKNEINNADTTIYPNSKKYFDINLLAKNNSEYHTYVFAVKENDKKYIMYSLSGMKYFENEIDKCKKFKDSVDKEIQPLFSNSERSDYEHIYKTVADGKSIAYVSDFNLFSGSIRIYCIKWSDAAKKETNFKDSFSLDIATREHLNWLTNEAFK